MAKRKVQRQPTRGATQTRPFKGRKGYHRSPDSITIESDKHLIELLEKYIKEKGFMIDAKTFGQLSESEYDSANKMSSSKTRPIPNEYTYHVIVSIDGFCNYLNRNKNYYMMYVERIKDESTKLELNAEVRMKLMEHNLKGNSLGHISNNAYNVWHAQTFNRDNIEHTKEMNKVQLKLAQLNLAEAERAHEELMNMDEDSGQDVIKRNMEYLGNLMNNAK